jgi:NAD(P)-dependent dehydrogenase (short-subunit alcohol dehydrogenase family)
VIEQIRERVPAADIEAGVAVDFLDPDSVRAYAGWLMGRPWGIDILVNNAGGAAWRAPGL